MRFCNQGFCVLRACELVYPGQVSDFSLFATGPKSFASAVLLVDMLGLFVLACLCLSVCLSRLSVSSEDLKP